jgi:hypothetical protein
MMNQTVKNFFVEDNGYLKINSEIKTSFNNEQEKAKFLVELIKVWPKALGCGGGNEDGFGYKTPSTCGGCARTYDIIERVWGSVSRFNDLFCEFLGDRQYVCDLLVLRKFAESGDEAAKILAREIKEEKQQAKRKAEEKKELEAKKERENRINSIIGEQEISDSLRKLLFGLKEIIQQVKMVDPDIALVYTDRSDWSGGAGTAYFDQVTCFYYDQKERREWQWRDKYSASNDRWDLRICGFGKVEIKNHIVRIELLNKWHGNRWTEFKFNPPKPVTKTKQRSKEDVEAHQEVYDNTKAKVMEEKTQLWELKPEMLASTGNFVTGGNTGYCRYAGPFVDQEFKRPEICRSAFIAREQIDHRGSVPQMRFELYLIKDTTTKMIWETHFYAYPEVKNDFINIVELSETTMEIETADGKKTLRL